MSPMQSRDVSRWESESNRADRDSRTLEIGRTRKRAEADAKLDRDECYVAIAMARRQAAE